MQCLHQCSVTNFRHIPGEQGEIRVWSDLPRVLSPSWSNDLAADLADLDSDLADLWGSVGHLVLSLEAGARAHRELMRSLWAGEVARRRRLVFVVAHSDESDEDLRRESEEHDD